MLVDTFQHRLKQAMDEAGLKQVDLVHQTKLDKSLINKYLAGISNAKQKKLTILANTLHVSEVWLMGYDVPKAPIFTESISPTQIPLLKKLSSEKDFIKSKITVIHIPESLAKTGDFFALMVTDNSMSHSFVKDDILIIKKQNNCEDNTFAVVSIGNSDAVLRKVKKNETGILLQCLNPAYDTCFYNHEQIKSLPITIWGIVKELQRNF